MSTSCHSCNYDTTWLNVSDTAVHHMSYCEKWRNQQMFLVVHLLIHIEIWKHQYRQICLPQYRAKYQLYHVTIQHGKEHLYTRSKCFIM